MKNFEKFLTEVVKNQKLKSKSNFSFLDEMGFSRNSKTFCRNRNKNLIFGMVLFNFYLRSFESCSIFGTFSILIVIIIMWFRAKNFGEKADFWPKYCGFKMKLMILLCKMVKFGNFQAINFILTKLIPSG